MARKPRKSRQFVVNSQAVIDDESLDIEDEASSDEPTDNAVLTADDRDKLPKKDFALGGGRYPIPDEEHGRNALARVAQHGTPEEKATVRAKVAKKFPGIEQGTNNSATESDSSLVINQMQTLTANLDTVHVQYRKLDGVNYMVAPMVMITEGVHAGSNGPLLYTANELNKTPVLWDHKPVTVNHPTINGQPVSACSPAAIELQKVGMILNTQFKSGGNGQPARLCAEAWLLPDKLKRVDERVYNAVKRQQRVEVSTGLFCDQPQESGTWNKEYYDAVAKNFRADHLAILPDEKGSCSLEDGAGLMRNAEERHHTNNSGATMQKTKRALVDAVIANEHMEFDEGDRDVLSNFDEGFLEKMLAPVANADDEEGNNDEVLDAKGQLAAKKGGKIQKGSPQDAGKAGDSLCKTKPKLGNGVEDSEVDKGTTPHDKRTEDDIGPDGAQPDGSAIRNQQEYDMQDEIQDQLIDNVDPESMDLVEYAESLQAPAAVKAMIVNGARMIQNHQEELRQTILANERNIYTEEYLRTLGPEELEGLAALAAPQPTANSEIGMLGVTQQTQSVPVLNAGYAGMYAGAGYAGAGLVGGRTPTFRGSSEKALEIPTLNFSKRDRDKKLDGDQGDDENTDSDD